MADELNISTSFRYSPGTLAEIRRGDSLLPDVTTKEHVHIMHNVGITEEAIILGDVAAPNWCWIKNHDATNFVELRVATSGAKFCKLLAGESATFRFGTGATVPYIIADTGACLVEYIIVDL